MHQNLHEVNHGNCNCIYKTLQDWTVIVLTGGFFKKFFQNNTKNVQNLSFSER